MAYRQPALHDLDLCVRAPTAVVSDHMGQLRGRLGHGVLHADIRVLSRAELVLQGSDLTALRTVNDGTARSRFVALAREVGDPGPDPTVRVERVRETTVDGMFEEIHVISTASMPVRFGVSMSLSADLIDLGAVKAGSDGSTVPFTIDRDVLSWGRDGITVTATGSGTATLTGDGGALHWDVALGPRDSTVLSWRLTVTDPAAVVAAPVSVVEWSRPEVTADDPRLAALVRQSLDDLAALRLVTTDRPDQPFLAAGAPWFCTLFGRDSLWAARLLLPLGTDLAASTLRALAGRQGKTTDRATAEAPGKILHELRRNGSVELLSSGASLPPVYYGTIDATPLWVCLLHDAWRWGMSPDDVEELLPHAEAALGWLAGDADPDGDGFVEYLDETGRGLANQGWKDSGDSIRFRDGRIATPPIALCEVQGYAYEAAVKGAALLTAFGRSGDRWLTYAADLADRFRARFWVADADGPYPAIALDGDKRPVDALSSNIGHLVGSGMLTPQEVDSIAARLVAPDMSSGFGLRTMSSRAGGYSPLSYHCGSVWPHDTVIVAQALSDAGRSDVAVTLVEGLLRAAPAFDFRLPELFGGDSSTDLPVPTPYPAACHPQAWAAAAGVGALRVLTGLRPDMPNRALSLAPPVASPVGALSVSGLRLGTGRLDVSLDAAGHPLSVRVPMGVTVTGQAR